MDTDMGKGPRHKFRKSYRVYYVTGEGWHYKLHGDVRGPFKDAEAAGIAMESERRELRAIREVRLPKNIAMLPHSAF